MDRKLGSEVYFLSDHIGHVHNIMLWFKFSFGAKFLKLVQFLFSFVVHHYYNMEQWQIKLKTMQKTLNQG